MVTMMTEDHIRTARGFLDAADREFAVGDNMQASEKLWGAASQAVIAVAIDRGWNHGSHRALKNNALRLADEYDAPDIRAGFIAAEKFHRNFYYGFMEDFELNADRPEVRLFVRRMAELLSSSRA